MEREGGRAGSPPIPLDELIDMLATGAAMPKVRRRSRRTQEEFDELPGTKDEGNRY